MIHIDIRNALMQSGDEPYTLKKLIDIALDEECSALIEYDKESMIYVRDSLSRALDKVNKMMRAEGWV